MIDITSALKELPANHQMTLAIDRVSSDVLCNYGGHLGRGPDYFQALQSAYDHFKSGQPKHFVRAPQSSPADAAPRK